MESLRFNYQFKSENHYTTKDNPAESWRCWKQRFELYLVTKEATEKADKIRNAMLLSAIGSEVLERYNHFTWADGEDNTKFDTVLAKLETELTGLKRVFSRYTFGEFQRTEQPPVDDYLTNLKILARCTANNWCTQ